MKEKIVKKEVHSSAQPILPGEYWPMPLPFGLVGRVVYGGPYRNRPEGMFGVRLDSKINMSANIVLPIEDFSVPKELKLLDAAVVATLEAVRRNTPVYIGCGWGYGRTGLFLSLLAKTMGVADPIEYVRGNYNHKAVERKSQETFINTYKPPIGKARVFLMKALALGSGVFPSG